MEDLSQYSCDCDDGQNEYDHDPNCSLWDSWGFEVGAAYWNPGRKRLEYLDDDDLDELGFDPEGVKAHTRVSLHSAVDDAIGGTLGDLPPTDDDEDPPEDLPPAGHIIGASKRTWSGDYGHDPMMKEIIESTIDIWLKAGGDAPPNFTYRGVTWVWSAEKAQWQSCKMGCYCNTIVMDPETLECVECEVYRHTEHSAKWYALNYRVGEITCEHNAMWNCTDCHVMRSEEWEPWLRRTQGQLPLGPTKPYAAGGATSYGSTTSTYQYVAKCRHYGQEVVFPNGVKVWCSSHFTRTKEDEPLPDFGFYLDGIWKPQCLAFYVPWADMGLPQLSYKRVAEGMEAIYTMAEKGNIVEIGCIGGHGRTGTVLACLAVIAGVPALEAVEWVHENYCPEAIESYRQEWFVEWFDAHRRGVEAPPEPPHSVFGMKRVDKGKNGEKLAVLYKDTKGVMYCGECQTDCKEDDKDPKTCWWCLATFAPKDKVEEATKSWSGPKVASEVATVHLQSVAQKAEAKKAKKREPTPIPKELLVATSDTEGVRKWLFDLFWPENRPRVVPVDGFHCSHCKDKVSWRYPSNGLAFSGWVHRSDIDLGVEECEAKRQFAKCKWNILGQIRQAEKTHGVKLIVPEYLTKKEEVSG